MSHRYQKVPWTKPSPQIPRPEFQAPASLSDVVKQRKHHLSRATRHLLELEKTRSELEHQNTELEKWRNDVTNQLDAVKQDMDAIRSIAPSEGHQQEIHPVQDFRVVERATELFILEFMEQVVKELPQLSIREGLSRRNDTMSLTINSFLDFASHNYSDAPFSCVIEIILYYTLYSWMMRNIFDPFVPGGSEEEAFAMRKLHRSVMKMEAPDRSARWGVITYTYLKRDSEVCEKIAKCLLGDISSLLGSFRSWKVPDDVITALFETKAQDLALRAITFQDMVRTSYTSFIYEILKYQEKEYRADHVKVIGGKGKPSFSVIPVGIGLFEVKTEKDGQGGIDIHETCIHRIRVIGNTWAPVI